MRMRQSKNLSAIPNPPNTRGVISACRNDEIAIRAVDGPIQTLTRSKWRRYCASARHIEDPRFAQPLHRQELLAIRAESRHSNLFGRTPQLYELWTLIQDTAEPEAMYRCEVPVRFFQRQRLGEIR